MARSARPGPPRPGGREAAARRPPLISAAARAPGKSTSGPGRSHPGTVTVSTTVGPPGSDRPRPGRRRGPAGDSRSGTVPPFG
eukprot:758625-Hanusia_phi.AAC.4